jgi:hypothetical protein
METTDNPNNFLRAEAELVLTQVSICAFCFVADLKTYFKGSQIKI